MTTRQIAQLFHARRSGNWKGRPSFMCKCPAHDDRMASLSITEGDQGKTLLHCFTGCTTEEILRAKGLRMGDLFADKRTMTPAIRQELSLRERLEVLERRHGLIEWIWALNPESRYWAAAAQSSFEEWYWMRCKLFPEEKRKREQEYELQRIISEYGFDELWECLPWNQ